MAWAVDLTIDIALEALTGGAWTSVMAAKNTVAGSTKAAKTGAKGIKAVARDGVSEIVEHADDLGGAARQAAKHVDDATTNAITQGRRGMHHADNIADTAATAAKAVPDEATKPKNILDRIASFFIHNDVTKTLGIHDELTAFANKLGLKACFAAGTPLLTPEGSKPIEEFKVGDLVLSRNEHDPNGPIEAKVVEELFRRYAPILHVHLPNGVVVRTTGEHPFYVEGKGWIPAHAMVAGDRLLSHDGQTVTVEEVFDTGEWDVVYNLRVADCHTFFVGGDEWGFSVWSHNAGCTPEQAKERIQLLQKLLFDDNISLSASYRAKIRAEISYLETFINGGFVEKQITQPVRGKPSRTRTVYQNTQDFDGGVPQVLNRNDGIIQVESLELLDAGATNKQLMEKGYAPIGRDGAPINLHHLEGTEPGPMMELLDSVHKSQHERLHDMITSGVQGNSTLKSAYRRWAKKYWKERSKDF